MKNKLINVILGLIVVVGIVLCAVLLSFARKEKSDGGVKKTTKQENTTAQIINAPTVVEDIKTVLAVVTSIDEETRKVGVRFVEDENDKIFSVGKGVCIYTQYDYAIALSQLDRGDVVDITYDTIGEKLKEIRISDKAVGFSRVTGISVNVAERVLSFYSKKYNYSKKLVIVSGEELITPEQISSRDVVTVYEYDNKLVSIVVNRGHGYLSLTGIDTFLGGYVDIGGEMLRQAADNMLLTVTEGEYKIKLSNGQYFAQKTAVIKRDEVTVLDFSEFVEDTIITGNVLFDINVDGAKLYLNGKETEYEKGIITLSSGTYQVKVAADGFEVYTDKIEVTDDYQKIKIELVPSKSEAATQNQSTSVNETTKASQETTKATEKETSQTEEQSTEPATKVSEKTKVFIDGPEGAMIYFDGKYLGVAPLSFMMITGEHTIVVLTQTEARGYNVFLVEGADDVRYDFTPKQ